MLLVPSSSEFFQLLVNNIIRKGHKQKAFLIINKMLVKIKQKVVEDSLLQKNKDISILLVGRKKISSKIIKKSTFVSAKLFCFENCLLEKKGFIIKNNLIKKQLAQKKLLTTFISSNFILNKYLTRCRLGVNLQWLRVSGKKMRIPFFTSDLRDKRVTTKAFVKLSKSGIYGKLSEKLYNEIELLQEKKGLMYQRTKESRLLIQKASLFTRRIFNKKKIHKRRKKHSIY